MVFGWPQAADFSTFSAKKRKCGGWKMKNKNIFRLFSEQEDWGVLITIKSNCSSFGIQMWEILQSYTCYFLCCKANSKVPFWPPKKCIFEQNVCSNLEYYYFWKVVFIYQLEALRQESGQIYPKTNYKWRKTQSALWTSLSVKIPILNGLDIHEGNV